MLHMLHKFHSFPFLLIPRRDVVVLFEWPMPTFFIDFDLEHNVDRRNHKEDVR
jgi:hypothetical protein